MNCRNAMAPALLLPLCLGTMLLMGKDPAKKEDRKPAPKFKPVDITKQVVEWSSNKYLSPPTKFKAGHVTPRPLDAKALKKNKFGYVVQLPSKAPIPTPTIAQGKVFLSGGFHSKEFYCFDANSGKLEWGVTLDDDGPSSAVVEDGIVVFNTESCTIFALDAKTGKHLWSHWLGDPLTSTPTIANGMVFTSYPAGRGGQFGQGGLNQNIIPQKAPRAKPVKGQKQRLPCSHVLAALDLKTGNILWQRWLESDVMSAPVAIDDELYATSFAGVVYKFKQKDGKVISAIKSRATSAPVVVGKRVFWTERADNGKGEAMEAINARGRANNRQIYKQQKRKAAYLDPSVQKKSKLGAEGIQLDAANGFGGAAPQAANPLAGMGNIGQGRVSTLQAFQGSRLLHLSDNNINCMGDAVICTDPKTGKKKWSFQLKGDLKKQGGFLAAPPASAGGHIFLASLNGKIMQMEPDKGKVVQQWNVGSPVRQQVAIMEGRIFIGTQTGQLVMIDTKDKKLTGWSTWGGNSGHTNVVKSK